MISRRNTIVGIGSAGPSTGPRVLTMKELFKDQNSQHLLSNINPNKTIGNRKRKNEISDFEAVQNESRRRYEALFANAMPDVEKIAKKVGKMNNEEQFDSFMKDVMKQKTFTKGLKEKRKQFEQFVIQTQAERLIKKEKKLDKKKRKIIENKLAEQQQQQQQQQKQQQQQQQQQQQEQFRKNQQIQQQNQQNEQKKVMFDEIRKKPQNSKKPIVQF